MKLFSHLIMFSVCVLCVSVSDAEPWEPSPEMLERFEKRGIGIYREEQVPDYELPELLKTESGKPITSSEEWLKLRRPEIVKIFEEEMYGRLPGEPEELEFEVIESDPKAMDGAATLTRVKLNCRQGEEVLSIPLTLFTPNDRKPAPTFLLINNRDLDNTDPTRQHRSGFWPAEEMIARGYGIAAIQGGDLSPDRAGGLLEGLHRLFPQTDPRPSNGWGSLAAWGWGASRVMDFFETSDLVDETKVAVVGHSRGGKSALWTGARDQRFALVISNNSGCGGAALNKRVYGEPIDVIVDRFPYWFAPALQQYANREAEMPYDQHMLMALMAPRAVYVASAGDDLWADPRGEYLAIAESSPVFQLFGDEGLSTSVRPELNKPVTSQHMGYHIRPGKHNLTPVDWSYYADFADRLWK
ncbi:alpha/beta hydrolase family protein [Calycomorphotria hydatis]|uniref:4-O-methyl-glucuronoyl methylesterase-like domain-containing protein n=1 Tax=Calycomorphotria hydatis TaxID=2528027 RepID=A0A517TES1_9PLAN|nr:alpha/beta hydrolase [Calycomorphotria hydatis]QDT66867.1 hypothetical protein V22_41390 [Calycomorphotria hydatis]